jgi:murein peptide amidase A
MRRVTVAAAAFIGAACSRGSHAGPVSDPPQSSVVSTTPAAATTVVTTTTTAAPPTTTAAPTTVASTTTSVPGIAGLAADALQVVEIGRSVDGRPITAVERGTPGGTVVLVIGVIHGDETAGVKIVEDLATADIPPGIDVWLIESMNPDGQKARIRTNAHLVDLNRNFPYEWAPLGEPGDSEYGGRGPASEPETQAIVDFVTEIHPDIGIWYHQDLNRIAPGQHGRDAEVRARYAELTGLPLLSITGGTYTGVAATWQRNTIADGVAFIVELGPRLTQAEAAVHAAAVLDVAAL